MVQVLGMGGVGKTALAVHWANQFLHRFPDGQIFIDMRGYSAAGIPVPTTATAGW
jgi:hypothetical protein